MGQSEYWGNFETLPWNLANRTIPEPLAYALLKNYHAMKMLSEEVMRKKELEHEKKLEDWVRAHNKN